MTFMISAVRPLWIPMIKYLCSVQDHLSLFDSHALSQWSRPLAPSLIYSNLCMPSVDLNRGHLCANLCLIASRMTLQSRYPMSGVKWERGQQRAVFTLLKFWRNFLPIHLEGIECRIIFEIRFSLRKCANFHLYMKSCPRLMTSPTIPSEFSLLF